VSGGGAGGANAGNGGSNSGDGGSATANRGGGGGGATNVYTPGNGGSGIVIIRYSDTKAALTSTTGSPSVTTSGGYRIYQWTGSGSFTV
jgi:hypothetical protein